MSSGTADDVGDRSDPNQDVPRGPTVVISLMSNAYDPSIQQNHRHVMFLRLITFLPLVFRAPHLRRQLRPQPYFFSLKCDFYYPKNLVYRNSLQVHAFCGV